MRPIVIALVLVAVIAGCGSSSSPPRRNAPRSTATTRPGAPGSRTSTAAQTTGPPGTTPVPVLMYHVIAPPPADAPYPALYVPPAEFAAQMQALKAAGWHAVTLDQVRAYWLHGVPLGPGKPIVLSFDNGYHSQYAQALPILRRLGWVGDENLQLTGLPPSEGGLSDQEVKALVAAGWEIDTQGISHADLIALDPAELHDQVFSAREQLRRLYGVPVDWFCYPSGHYDAEVISVVKAAGFVGSTTVVPGWAAPGQDPFRMPRVRVNGGTSPSALLAEIAAERQASPPPPAYGGRYGTA